MAAQVLQCGVRSISLDIPQVMGILNVTPDSFSDGGKFVQADKALAHVADMIAAGAHIIDVGGESTRPGAADVPLQQELDRVIPVLEAVTARFDIVVSIDTSKPEVMLAAAGSGAGMLNDVRALQEKGATEAAASTGLPVCLMHMQGQPRTMQASPKYANVVSEVIEFIEKRVGAALSAGVDSEKILIDPGFGFGKTLSHNIDLVLNLGKLAAIHPVIAGVSRKRMIGEILGDDALDRTIGSVTAAVQCIANGASIVRVHDVHATAQALTIWQALNHRSDCTAPVTG